MLCLGDSIVLLYQYELDALCIMETLSQVFKNRYTNSYC